MPDPDSASVLSFDQARALVLALASAVPPSETVPLAEAVGRISAERVLARRDLPPFPQAAMDGYALARATTPTGEWVEIHGRTAAGEPPGTLEPGFVHRILTGAPMPAGADAVVEQEAVEVAGPMVRLARVPAAGANQRARGEDMRAGEMLVPAGTRLDWRHITVLAAQGCDRVRVTRRVRVALLGSGRELRQPGETAEAAQIFDSNRPMLAALLIGWGAELILPPLVPDDEAAMRAALREAAREADLVLTNAGISVGEEDHVRTALRALGGNLAVLKVAMKPGKPLAAGRLGQALFVGLPGNPQAALAGAVAFVRPLLARMSGAEPPAALSLRAGFALHRKTGRTELIPVRLTTRGAEWWAERAGPDGSGRLAPLLRVGALAVLPAEAADITEGTPLTAFAFGPGDPFSAL